MSDFELAEEALKLIGAIGHLVAGHNKNPIYPGKDWHLHGNQLPLETAMSAWRAWGTAARGVGIVMRDSFVVLDFDPFEKTRERSPQGYVEREQWRVNFENRLLQYTYAEQSRSRRGSHFVLKVSGNYVGRRGIELFKHHFAIDVLTGSRYCDITGYRLNDLPVANGDLMIGRYLTQLEESYADTEGTSGVTYQHGTYTMACLEELLEYVKVDLEDYGSWIEIGLALFNETHGSNIGLKLWDNWSAKMGGVKYTGSHDLTYKWSTFKLNRYKYSVGSIIRRAKAGGANVAQIRLRHRVFQEVAGLRTMKVGDHG